MSNFLLYTITALIWGSTWYAIQFQLGSVSPLWSVAYRFTLASILLLFFCIIRKHNLKYNLKTHIGIAIQGLLMFCLNYILFYLGSSYLISGVIAVIFASIQIMNIINSRIFLKHPITVPVIIGAFLGLSGLVLVFTSELTRIYPHHANTLSGQLIGLLICLIASLSASFGNIVSVFNQKKHIPILQNNALGMLYGAVFTIIIAIIFKQKPTMSWTVSYISSMLYLIVFGTIVAFSVYLKLLSNIGPGRAAYLFVVIPVIALTISSIFEDFQWHVSTIIGVLLIIFGNILVMSKVSFRKKKCLENQPEKAASTFTIQEPETLV